MTIVRMFTAAVVLGIGLLQSCASSRVEIHSVPEGAELRTLSGEVIGKTPLELSVEQRSKIIENGIASFRLFSPGYESRLVMVDSNGIRDIKVALPKIEGSFFKSDIAQDYSQDVNRLVRESFGLQKLLIDRKPAEIETKIDAYKKEFPQIAFGHILSAQISLSQGKTSEARANLERAKILDPQDSSIDQNLKLLREVKAK